MNPKILIVEDDENLGHLLKIVLRELSSDIALETNGWEALDHIIKQKPALIVLDIMLPGLNGINICKTIRQKNILTPILMLTSKSEVDDKVEGLNVGADDYVTKPFSNNEFLARCRALLRRDSGHNVLSLQKSNVITMGALKLDMHNKCVFKNNIDLCLSQKEYDLLKLFMTNPGRNYTRIELLDRIWGEHFEGLEHTVNTTINRIRMKIEDDLKSPQYIITTWGIGYKFNTPKDVHTPS